MTSGIIDLSKLHELKNSSQQFEFLDSKALDGKTYAKLTNEVMNSVPEKPGFYLWGNFNEKRFWTNIYLGKAGFGKITSLRKRILEELRDERVFLIQEDIKSNLDLNEKCRKIFPNMWDKSYKAFYERYAKKFGTTHIVWTIFQCNSNETIKEIENDLIESINPKANVQRKTPPTNLRNETIEILREFRHQIHEQRGAFKVKK